MSRLLLIFLAGCSAPDYSNPDLLHHEKPGPVAQSVRAQERKALDDEHAARMRRHEILVWVATNTPPLPTDEKKLAHPRAKER